MPVGRRRDSPTKSHTRWGKWELDDDDRDLISKYGIRVRQHTQKLISNSYWSTIHQIIPAQKATQITLPASYQLDTANWIQVFFDYLTKPPASSEFSEHVGFSIPETAVIRRRRATSLLRSDPEHGRHHVDRITQTAMLEPSALFETLMTAASKLVPVVKPTTVVAVLIASTFDDRQGWIPVVEYMTEEILKSYLFNRLMIEDREAILQVFVPPAGEYNTLIRAWYSHHSIKLEQRVNLHAVTDPYKDPQKRCSTFDGPNHYSEMRAIPGMDLRDQLSDTVDVLVSRLSPQLPASKTLQRGLFYFKMGKDGQLWFLFCSGLSITNSNSKGSPISKDKFAAPSLRPITPASVQSTWFTDGAQANEAQGIPSDAGLSSSSTKILLQDGCPSCSAQPKPADMLPVPFMSLLRRLNPQLYSAVVREAAIAKQASRSHELWASYLEAARAAEMVFYGESINQKFPRSSAEDLMPLTAASRRKRGSNGHRRDGEDAARVAKCVRWLRLVAQAHRPSHRLTASSEFSPARFSSGKITPIVSPTAASLGENRSGGGGRGVESRGTGKSLTAQEQRELVLYLGTNLSTFEQLQAGVCTECCLTMNKSDLTKAFKDLSVCMAPLNEGKQPKVSKKNARSDGREAPRSHSVMGFANEDHYLPSRPRSLLLPEIESASRSPTNAHATEDDIGEEDGEEMREKVRLVTRFSVKAARRTGQSRRGRASPELKTIDESGAAVTENEREGASSPGIGGAGRSVAEDRTERFRIDGYKERVGESLADAISLREQIVALDSDLYREEEAIEEDHKALQLLASRKSASTAQLAPTQKADHLSPTRERRPLVKMLQKKLTPRSQRLTAKMEEAERVESEQIRQMEETGKEQVAMRDEERAREAAEHARRMEEAASAAAMERARRRELREKLAREAAAAEEEEAKERAAAQSAIHPPPGAAGASPERKRWAPGPSLRQKPVSQHVERLRKTRPMLPQGSKNMKMQQGVGSDELSESYDSSNMSSQRSASQAQIYSFGTPRSQEQSPARRARPQADGAGRKGGAISETPQEAPGMMASDSRPSTVAGAAGAAGQGGFSRVASEAVMEEDVADEVEAHVS